MLAKIKIFSITLLIFTVCIIKTVGQDTAYYFGYSRAIKMCGINELRKESILYTEIHSCLCGLDSLSSKSKLWQAYAYSNCLNKMGCTADLYYFGDYKVAKLKLKDLLGSKKEKPRTKLVQFE